MNEDDIEYWLYPDTVKLITAYEKDYEWYDENIELLIAEVKDLANKVIELSRERKELEND